MLSIKEFTIALFPPSHPIIVFEFINGTPGFDGFAKVTFDQFAKVINAQGMDQILHARIGPHLTIAVIPLGGNNGLHEFHGILQGDKTQMIGRAGKGIGLVMGTTHTPTDHDIESFHLSIGIGHHDTSNIIGVNVQGIITHDRDTDFELAGQVSIGINGFDGILDNDTTAIIVGHGGINVVLGHFGGPFDGLRGSPAVQPNTVKGIGHGSKEFGKDLGPFPSGVVGGIFEGGWSAHDVTTDITTGTDGTGSGIHNGSNHVLEVPLANAVHLEALTRGGAQIPLSTIP
mmetsp:Transcript_8221/g.17135  ORF Transcript_8221/g.17135 Transcript_8221/m.17135 type:complete len:287 (-) Transcript_8221:482-1342(-)